MADIDIDPFEEHESRPDEPTGKNIHLTLVEDHLENQIMNII